MYYNLLIAERNYLLRLQLEWRNPLVSNLRLETAHRYALETVESIIGGSQCRDYVWIPLWPSVDVPSRVTCDSSIEDSEESSDDTDNIPEPGDTDWNELLTFTSDSEGGDVFEVA